MIFALGFLVSGLLALLFLPAFWRRAARLSARRFEMQMPLSMGEIVAERDQLRAEAAVERRRVEQRVEALVEDRARDMSEIGRRAAIISALDADIARLKTEESDLATRLAAREADLLAARSELGVLHQETYDLSGRLDQRQVQLAAAAALETKLREDIDTQRVALAALETRAAGLEIQDEDLKRSLQQLRLDVADKTALVQKVTDEREFLRLELQNASARRDQATASATSALARVQELEESLRTEHRARVRAENDLAIATRAQADIEVRERSLRDGHESQLTGLRASERDVAQKLEDLRAQNARLQGALDVARRELDGRPDARPVKGAAPEIAPAEAALLREAIADVGSQVTRLVGALEGQDKATLAGELIGDRMRALQAQAEKRQVAAG